MHALPTRTPSDGRAAPASAERALRDLRRALARGDADAVGALLSWAPRPAYERDLLVDLVAAYGVERAVARLRPFWARARPAIVGVRELPRGDTEVFEELALEGRTLRTSTLVRPGESGPSIVCTVDAPDDTLRLMILRGPEGRPFDAVGFTLAFQERYGPTAELVTDGDEGVVGHPCEGWVARLSMPAPVPAALARRARLPSGPGAPTERVELAMVGAIDLAERRLQMDWLGSVAAVMAQDDGAPYVLVPAADKVTSTRAFRAAAETGTTARALAATWARITSAGGVTHTRGLSQLLLPEVELALADAADAAEARRLVGSVALALIEGKLRPDVQGQVRIGGRRVTLVPGRRGPEPGRTYGLWGALRIQRAGRAGAVHQSHSRLRVDL